MLTSWFGLVNSITSESHKGFTPPPPFLELARAQTCPFGTADCNNYSSGNRDLRGGDGIIYGSNISVTRKPFFGTFIVCSAVVVDTNPAKSPSSANNGVNPWGFLQNYGRTHVLPNEMVSKVAYSV